MQFIQGLGLDEVLRRAEAADRSDAPGAETPDDGDGPRPPTSSGGDGRARR